MKSNVESE